MFSETMLSQAASVLEKMRAQGIKLATAESCTGGLLAAVLTEIPGASDVFDQGVISYSDKAKITLLSVSVPLLETYGAVSPETAVAMAEGMLLCSGADVALSITGIAGPGGGTPKKPVGTVHFALARRSAHVIHQFHVFQGTRHDVRLQAVDYALMMLLRSLE